MSVVVAMVELTDFQRDMLRARASAVLDRAEAKPEAPDVLRGAAARAPAHEDEAELEPAPAATAVSGATDGSAAGAGTHATAPGPAHSPMMRGSDRPERIYPRGGRRRPLSGIF